MEEEYPSYKLIVMGDPGTGKTSIIHRYVHEKFESNVATTVGVSNLHSIVKVGKMTVDLKIWDTAGQEQYSSLIPMFSRDSNVCLMVADFTRPDTINHLDLWIERLHKNGEDPPIIVAVNKTDLPGPRPIESLRTELSTKFKSVLFVSAATGSFINELFQSAAKLAIEFKNAKLMESGLPITNINGRGGCC